MNKAEIVYNYYLNLLEKVLGKGETYGDDLDNVGKKLFENKWRGVYPSDRVPKLKDGDMAIVNLDKHDEPGSHWIAVALRKNNLLVYDSFGRSTSRILKSLYDSNL